MRPVLIFKTLLKTTSLRALTRETATLMPRNSLSDRGQSVARANGLPIYPL